MTGPVEPPSAPQATPRLVLARGGGEVVRGDLPGPVGITVTDLS